MRLLPFALQEYPNHQRLVHPALACLLSLLLFPHFGGAKALRENAFRSLN